jgi:hypothetical protein
LEQLKKFGFAINKPALKEIVLPSNTDIAGFHFKAPLISIGCAVAPPIDIFTAPTLH